MGLTRMLGRTVFSKNRSFGAGHEHHHNGRGKRWSSVRSYLCGDELFDSVLAEEDSASVKTFVSGKSSEATVTQAMLTDHESVRADELGLIREDINIMHKEEQAALRIQSAFRFYMARRGGAQAGLPGTSRSMEGWIDVNKGSRNGECESVCTSLEVQTANSVKIFSVTQKGKAQPFKFKEDWDDSTVSSNISKMRMQNRLEAMTRRERALAYAFSQQLRTCSKKKASKSDNEETNMGWSWLERWMATRVPDKDEFHESKQPQDIFVTNRPISAAKEEKESCGSNEVFLQFNSSFAIKSPVSTHDPMLVKTSRNRALKPKKSVSKRKTVPSYHQFAKEA